MEGFALIPMAVSSVFVIKAGRVIFVKQVHIRLILKYNYLTISKVTMLKRTIIFNPELKIADKIIKTRLPN